MSCMHIFFLIIEPQRDKCFFALGGYMTWPPLTVTHGNTFYFLYSKYFDSDNLVTMIYLDHDSFCNEHFWFPESRLKIYQSTICGSYLTSSWARVNSLFSFQGVVLSVSQNLPNVYAQNCLRYLLERIASLSFLVSWFRH